jgi:hypothetical protein
MNRTNKSLKKIHPEQKKSNIPPPPSNKPEGLNIPTQQPIQSTPPSFINTIAHGFAWGVGTNLSKKIFTKESDSETTLETKTINNLEKKILSPDELFAKYEECLANENTNENCEDILNK